MDFKVLLSDNAELVKRLQELGVPTPFLSGHTQSKLHVVPDPFSWVRCFLLFMAAKSDYAETREMAAYAVIVINVARSHGGDVMMLFSSNRKLLVLPFRSLK